MRWRGTEHGRALVEAVALGILLLVPMIWLLAALADVQRAALGTSTAAREAAFAAARADSQEEGAREAELALAGALRDHGLETSVAIVRWDRPPAWMRGEVLSVRVSYEVPVMRLPMLDDASPTVRLSASASALIDPYRSR